jgi:hypothetical protein
MAEFYVVLEKVVLMEAKTKVVVWDTVIANAHRKIEVNFKKPFKTGKTF